MNLKGNSILPKKGSDIKLNIESLALGGMGISHIENYVVFVKNAIPGQTVLGRITKKKSSYFEARSLEVINESNDFVKPECNHFYNCGGCSFQNLQYNKQLYYKELQINDLYNRIGKFKTITSEPIVKCNNIYK